jgi:hypothetical protein
MMTSAQPSVQPFPRSRPYLATCAAIYQRTWIAATFDAAMIGGLIRRNHIVKAMRHALLNKEDIFRSAAQPVFPFAS